MVEKSYPDLIPFLSSCKSPQMMMGSVIKNFFAEEHQLTPNDIISVSVMPCMRKQGARLMGAWMPVKKGCLKEGTISRCNGPSPLWF